MCFLCTTWKDCIELGKKIEEDKSWSKNVLSVHFTVQLISSIEWIACVWHIAWVSRQNLSILLHTCYSFIRSRRWTCLGNVFCIVFVESEWREKWMSHYRHTLTHAHFVQFPQNSNSIYLIPCDRRHTFTVTIAHNYRSHLLAYFYLVLWVCIFDSSFL